MNFIKPEKYLTINANFRIDIRYLKITQFIGFFELSAIVNNSVQRMEFPKVTHLTFGNDYKWEFLVILICQI